VSAAQITTAERARRSVRGRLMMVVLVTTAIAVLLAGIAMLTQDLLLYRRAWVSDLSTEARILALSTAPAVAFDDEAAAERNLAALQPRTSVLVAAVYGASGNLYSAYVRPGEPPPPAHMFPQGEGSRMVGNRTELTQPITRNGEVLGTIYLRARYDVVSRIQGYLSIFALVTLICMAVALALSNALQKSLTEPLQAMTRVARQIVDRRDYSLRVAESTGDEIGIVIDAFNGMLDEVQLRSQALEQSNSALQNEVSVRQAAESALSLANARLEIAMKALIEADQRKDEFLATLAHELRNPLAPIRHAVKLLDAEGADETQRKWGREVIARQVHRMALLLDDLLDVSRITRGRLELKLGHVSLESLVSSAVETARPLLDAKKHDLEVSLPADPLELQVDPLRLSQVLSNLLTNAAKYTDAAGSIKLTAVLTPEELRITVSDNGIGLAPAAIPNLFEIFSQVESALDRAEGGLGIGLALVKGLVGLHGGSVEAHSDGLGHGSTFTVRLPAGVVCPPLAPAEATAAPRSDAFARCKVLVADDNRDAVDSLAIILELSGYEVLVAHTGREALELGMSQRPDAVILDIGMPDINGYDVARRIRAESWGRGAFLLAITGWGQSNDKERARMAGFDLHFTKPVDVDEIEHSLRNFLGRRGADTGRRPARRTADR
jgi:signal transduction histidine kinase/CheY-like chemotaxis protein